MHTVIAYVATVIVTIIAVVFFLNLILAAHSKVIGKKADNH